MNIKNPSGITDICLCHRVGFDAVGQYDCNYCPLLNKGLSLPGKFGLNQRHPSALRIPSHRTATPKVA